MLAAGAAQTSRIRLTSAVSVLSSDDPVRVFQQFATLDLLSGGRAEIMAGRGSFIESFPLFGYDLADYDQLFAEKLELLLELRESSASPGRAGTARRSTTAASTRDRCRTRCRSGSPSAAHPESAVRAGMLGLPMALAIIGGLPERFAPFAELHREAARRAGHDPTLAARHQLARLHRRDLAGAPPSGWPPFAAPDDEDRPRARLAAGDQRRIRRRRARCAAQLRRQPGSR